MRISNWFRLLTVRLSRRHPRRLSQRPVFRPRLEGLEDRLTPTAGLLDPTFGAGAGYVLSSFTNHLDAAYAVTVQSDGKIVVAGKTTASSSRTGQDFLVARYNADGSPDTSFGTAGDTATDFNRSTDSAQAVAVQSDGKILAAGTANTSKGPDFALARYNANGTLDTTFGSKGKVTTNLGGSIVAVETMAVQADGKILVSGSEGVPGSVFFALVRYNANGTLDTTFGNGGKLVTNIQLGGGGRSVIQPDGKIVLAGTTVDPTSGQAQFVVARFNANGTADSGFGSGGKVTTHLGSGDNSFGGVALQADGKIVVSGDEYIGSNAALCLVRYNADGTLDTTFGTSGNGIVTVPPPAGFMSVSTGDSGVEVQSDGKIVAGASLFNSSGGSNQQWNFGAVRVNADGTVDTSYGNGGWATVEIGYGDSLQASTLQPDGRLLLAGAARPTSNTFPTDVALIRFTGDTTTPAAAPALAATQAALPVAASSPPSSAPLASSSTAQPEEQDAKGTAISSPAAVPTEATDQVFAGEDLNWLGTTRLLADSLSSQRFDALLSMGVGTQTKDASSNTQARDLLFIHLSMSNEKGVEKGK